MNVKNNEMKGNCNLKNINLHNCLRIYEFQCQNSFAFLGYFHQNEAVFRFGECDWHAFSNHIELLVKYFIFDHSMVFNK